MSACEKCWADAFRRSFGLAKTQSECYVEILAERKGHPCTPEQQAGQWWDEDAQADTRPLDSDADLCGRLAKGDPDGI